MLLLAPRSFRTYAPFAAGPEARVTLCLDGARVVCRPSRGVVGLSPKDVVAFTAATQFVARVAYAGAQHVL